MPILDDYITDTLMRDLVGHDRKPVSFLVYLWLAAEQAKTRADVQASYQHVAEAVACIEEFRAGCHWLAAQTQTAGSEKGECDGDAPVYRAQSRARCARRLNNDG